MEFVIGFFVLFGLLVLYLIVQAKKAGPPQVSDMELSRGVRIAGASAADPGHGWSGLGSRTTAEGLNLKFDHDDDPQAEATFLVDPSKPKASNALAHNRTVRLGPEFEAHHVHTRGYVFRVRMRGTGPVVNKEVRIQMRVAGDGTPIGGRVENDDDTDAAVGGWIEFEEVEVLEVGRGR